jgi:hypothetical protein
MRRAALAVVMVVQSMGTSVPGTVAFRGEELEPPANLSRIHIVLARPDDGDVLARMAVGQLPFTALPGATVADDGTFVIDELAPGTYFVSAMFVPRPWKLASVLYGGREIAEAGMTVERSPGTGGLALTFSDRPTTISGVVRLAEGTAATSSTVVAFPQEPGLWRIAGLRLRTVSAGADGEYVLRDLPPGHYFVVPTAGVDRESLSSAGYLEQLSRTGVQVTLGDGQHVTQDLVLPK